MDRLAEVMRRLRDPETGCPWDIEQSFETIVPYTIEEAYEVADAVKRSDMNDLREELGDLLFQSVYHAQMAQEAGHFTLGDVIETITEKMISRHPHVFGERKAENPEDVNAIWDELKSKERAQKNTDISHHSSALDGVAHALPALLRAEKLQKRAAKTGFEWTNPTDILDKLEEEIAEMRRAIKNKDFQNQQEELGDIFFVLTNLARHLGISAETALRSCNDKFVSRFQGMEEEFSSTGKNLSAASLEEKIASWNRQKEKQRLYDEGAV